MTQPEDLKRENEALRERLSRLSEASLRINESLDFDTVLQEVLDCARSLTASRYGVMTLVDEGGRVEDFLSSGMTAEEAEELWLTPDGWRVFRSLTGISEPLRGPDLVEHVQALGFTEFSVPLPAGVLRFMAAPMVHQGVRVGHVFVGEKDRGEEYSRAEEETLVMFASQAAMVIANARRYREEQRARADLETLVNTSPVGVVVFDARTGTPVSFNREARRILDILRDPDQSPERLLQVLAFRRADGRETSLEEYTLAQALSAGETVRAEEIVLRVPDGRNVTVLLNATPIRSDDGEVESFVVTLQDMTPLEEMERLRAEFLGMVSHELRTPLAAIKGSITTLLDPSAALNPAEMTQFFRIIDAQTDRMRELISDLIDVVHIETGTLSVSPGPEELAVLVDEARNAFLNGGNRNNLRIEMASDLPLVMADRLRIVQVLSNLLTNAARHSPEASTIRLTAVGQGVHVAVSVSDQGRGIPAESLPHLFRRFSRIDSEDQGADTGLGLAICKGIVEAHGGRIWGESDGPGLGARFTFTIPMVEETGTAAVAVPAALSALSLRRAAGERTPILAVDDDPQALRYIRDALSKAGYSPIVTGDAKDVPRLMEEAKPHLVLLDLMLPGADGIEIMKEIQVQSDVPVIFVSAYGQDETVAKAFDLGASDYVVKPFSPTELAARIRAALRKQAAEEPTEPYALGDLAVNYSQRRVTLAGLPVHLTAIEYRTLAELTASGGRVLTYEILLRRVWGADKDADVRPMRTVISSLRRKLGDDSDNPTYIFTEPRVGYRMPKGEAPGRKEATGP